MNAANATNANADAASAGANATPAAEPAAAESAAAATDSAATAESAAAAESTAAAQCGPLTGFTVAVTAARRADELIALLERRGADVLRAPALRIVPLAHDAELHAATRALIADPPDTVVATTGIGFRGWMEAADGWGDGEALRAALGGATLLARGPKARGAIRAAGLTEEWSPASESSAEVLDRLLGEDLAGRRIAVQMHGEPLPDFLGALRAAGAQVLPVPVYRWIGPADTGPLDRLIDAVIAGSVSAVTFTSAPAASGLLLRARELGREQELEEALRTRTEVLCVGPVTAAPLLARRIHTTWPERFRIGALVRHVVEVLPRTAARLPVGGHWLEVRGTVCLVDGAPRPVPPGPMAVLRELARTPGRVVPRSELLAVLPGGGYDEHAVEAAVARLRAALGAPRVVQTVVKRGYRLALDTGDCAAPPAAPATTPARAAVPAPGAETDITHERGDTG
ncbi:uroporphyrinogen-III synthase [Allostreptomyces psammosilenae]|uniref:Uroporphyrinogen-III synthase n=1 Tax=Allostreptomyces psammosilenae TaxID=1892865 RepID=A0A852ZUT2_9ACTN|nr:uroporphyrinogen-III synthase [Allostreptomyces psammosilenae]NYI05347.1 uroporphyrinogen-III synthase [Allostreptomyces psammosilenae]